MAGLPADFPPLKTLDSYPNNLPVQLTPLIGREQEVAAVRSAATPGGALVTLTGPGGTGKTRLGLQVAAELSELFTDGVFFVNLAPLSDPELVVLLLPRRLASRSSRSTTARPGEGWNCERSSCCCCWTILSRWSVQPRGSGCWLAVHS